MGRRRGSDPVLLWLWRKPAATAPIRPLAWEPPYATEAALEKAKRRKKKKDLEDSAIKRNIQNQNTSLIHLAKWEKTGIV